MTQFAAETVSRFLVGIDLGTTNSAVAYVDTAEKDWAVHDFAIPQLVGPGEVEAREVLPSFHYEAAAGEFAPGTLRLPWDAPDADPKYAVGFFARDHGAAVPGRLVVSAKSWLSHSGVDRTAGLLPWHGSADVERLSPVEVSSRYLAHIRAAWDHRFPDHPIARQDVVLTVPASFDEVARELTVQSARRAGLVKVVLVEEPQAAFYAWIYAHGGDWESRVRAGQKILVCDVGGGTSDFTLIRVRPAAEEKVMFHRIAVGDHLILGGDNLDLAVAHHVEKKVAGEGKLDARQWGPLVRTCRQVKETLLGAEPPERAIVNVRGGGAKLIGGAVQVEVTRKEIQGLLLDGFLAEVGLDARPAARRSGFQEFGLPYAPDPAITRYLATFLTAHRHAGESPSPLTPSPGTPGEGRGEGHSSAVFDRKPHSKDPHPNPLPEYRERGQRGQVVDAARPDLVLFNGGMFESPVLRQRLLDALASWFNAPGARKKWKPEVLRNDRLDLAVARGAAYYGMVRRGKGVRIRGGLAHSYYIGIETRNLHERPAVCLLPAGVEEGQTVDLSQRTFDLLIRQPVEFPLYFSSTRTTDRPGDLLAVDAEQMSALPPIRTVLQSGRKAAADRVTVSLNARLTEIGTLELWCAEATGDRQWKLQFDVRAAARADVGKHEAVGEAEGVVDEAVVERCRGLIRGAFRRNAAGATDPPAGLVRRLDEATGMSRVDWPSSLMRSLWESLMEVEDGRQLGVEHESRWLNLAGFCLRPGYGLAVDDWRVAQTWRLYPAGVYHPKNELIRAEWWILWRRVAGGLTLGQQQVLAEPLIADWRTWVRKSGSGVKGRSATFQFGPHETAEVWRLLGSLELLRPSTKEELGAIALDLLPRERVAAVRDALLFAIGRFGARVPVYGPLNALVPAETAETWGGRLIAMDPADEKAAFAVVQLSRRTDDRYRDVGDTARAAAAAWLGGRARPHFVELVDRGGKLETEEQRYVFGESLPRGLRIE